MLMIINNIGDRSKLTGRFFDAKNTIKFDVINYYIYNIGMHIENRIQQHCMSKCRKGKQHHEEGVLLIQSIHEKTGGQG